MKKHTLFYGLAAALIGLSLAAAPAMAQTQPTKPATAAANSQSAKKPAATCDGMDKKSKAYSDCVKTQAQTTKEKKPSEPKAAKADKVEKAKKTKTN